MQINSEGYRKTGMAVASSVLTIACIPRISSLLAAHVQCKPLWPDLGPLFPRSRADLGLQPRRGDKDRTSRTRCRAERNARNPRAPAPLAFDQARGRRRETCCPAVAAKCSQDLRKLARTSGSADMLRQQICAKKAYFGGWLRTKSSPSFVQDLSLWSE